MTVCASCGRRKQSDDHWTIVAAHTLVDEILSHGLCPDCLERLYAEEGLEG